MKRNKGVQKDISRRGFIETAAIGVGPAVELIQDPEFDRSARSLKPVETPPYYAVSLYPGMVCTHGGARRNGKAQILDPDHKPIPRLYSAGSFGSVYGRIYSVTAGNIGEVCAFGRIAGRNAAAEKPWS
jgi:predicted oxidoreductase